MQILSLGTYNLHILEPFFNYIYLRIKFYASRTGCIEDHDGQAIIIRDGRIFHATIPESVNHSVFFEWIIVKYHYDVQVRQR